MRNQININSGLFKKGGRILVALSGGADSVCLLHALAAGREKWGVEVEAAHFIHGIRPEAADAELALVRSLCDKLGVYLTVGHGDTPTYAAERSMGLEEAARELRYAFLYETMDKRGCDAIATAHNLSDNSETVLFNLVRGSGLAGAGGIPEKNGRVIRPLLAVSREEIEDYDSRNGLEYAVDRTNFDEKYSRNKLRLSVLPRMREINAGADMNILRFSRAACEAADFLRSESGEILSYEGRKEGEISFSQLEKAHPALRYYIFEALLTEAGGDGRLMDGAACEAVLKLCEKKAPSSRIDVGGGFEARIDYNGLKIEKKQDKSAPPGPLSVGLGRTVAWGGWRITIGGERGVSFALEQLEPPFIIRSRQPGDAIHMKNGSKSVKKYLIDKKIPAETRDFLPVICDNKGVLMLADLAKDGKRCYKNRGTPVKIDCGRISSDDE